MPSVEDLETLSREQAAFNAIVDELIDDGHEGQHVLFAQGAVQGFFDGESEAYAEGLRRYGTNRVFVIGTVTHHIPTAFPTAWELGLLHADSEEGEEEG